VEENQQPQETQAGAERSPEETTGMFVLRKLGASESEIAGLRTHLEEVEERAGKLARRLLLLALLFALVELAAWAEALIAFLRTRL
jgi:hypothetical protein